MTVQKKDIAAPAKATPKDAVDEIDEIMNEIEELQQSMASSQAAPATKTSPRAVAAAAPVAAEEEPNVMEEFQAGSSEVSMEETLGDLKDDEPSGPNLIDQAMEAEAARESATKTEEKPEDELLDESEAEALDDAVAAEEEAALQEIVSEDQEEEVHMSEAPRRGRSEGQSRSRGESKGGAVSLRLTGDLALRLSYEFEGQEVLIGFTDGALRVELSDGTEFKIPVRRNPLRKAA